MVTHSITNYIITPKQEVTQVRQLKIFFVEITVYVMLKESNQLRSSPCVYAIAELPEETTQTSFILIAITSNKTSDHTGWPERARQILN